MTPQFPLICDIVLQRLIHGEPVHLMMHDCERGEIVSFAFSQNPANHDTVMVHLADNAVAAILHLKIDQLETNSTLKKVDGRWLLKTS